MANVTCEYNTSTTVDDLNDEIIGGSTRGSGNSGSTSEPGRRIRRSETLLRQAAECVSRGQTFQTVSDMFQIPISTIRWDYYKAFRNRNERSRKCEKNVKMNSRFFMARKGILPRRKRGRASIAPASREHQHRQNSTSISSRSLSPTEPPFHFVNYKLPDLKQKLI